jgi:hypothetical protein
MISEKKPEMPSKKCPTLTESQSKDNTLTSNAASSAATTSSRAPE